MRLNKSTGHAVRILIDCANGGGQLVKVADIARRLEITQQNAFKIVHLLCKSGFLQSARGRHGGVRLAHPPSEIRIGDVVREIELTGSSAKDSEGSGDLNQIVDEALDAFVSVLDQHTLADMAKGQIPLGGASAGGTSRKVGGRPATSGSGRSRRGPQQAVAR